jgi:predicted acylesterase/phospholipase RssA
MTAAFVLSGGIQADLLVGTSAGALNAAFIATDAGSPFRCTW